MRKLSHFIEPFQITDGSKFRLKDHDPGETRDIRNKEEAVQYLRKGVRLMAKLQERLYADNHWALLLIFQAMDAAGKDSTIKHVMSGVNPMGCQIYSFRAPSSEELDHDYLWRTNRSLPERGRIGIFNRSYYEEVLVVRVHPELLDREKVPRELISKDIWEQRYEDINALEKYLSRNGIAICKFFLNVSKEEQKKRFLARLDTPEKNWKFSAADVAERQYWDAYQEAYEDAIRATATKHAPWYVVPADHKWFTRVVVASAVVQKLRSLDLQFPRPDSAIEELAAARAALEDED
jgi:PPK2 family polyphosphate:nucleotide phosphotransferase